MTSPLDERGLYYERMAASSDWDAATNVYETRRRLEIIFERLLAHLDLKDQRVLDAGSGGGHFSEAASHRGAVVTSMDVGKSLLEQVAARCDTERVVGSILEMPFEDDAFDVVLSTEVIEHTTEPRAGLRELARVVRPGGTVLVTSPCRLWQPIVRMASLLKIRPYQGYENFLWPGQARAELELCGVEVQSVTGFNFFPALTAKLDPVHRWTDRAGQAMPWGYVNYAIVGLGAP